MPLKAEKGLFVPRPKAFQIPFEKLIISPLLEDRSEPLIVDFEEEVNSYFPPFGYIQLKLLDNSGGQATKSHHLYMIGCIHMPILNPATKEVKLKPKLFLTLFSISLHNNE